MIKQILFFALVLVVVSAGSHAGFAASDDAFKSAGTILVRVRGVSISPDVSSKVTVIGGKARVGSTWVPEVDITYFFTDHIAAELIAATSSHGVRVTGSSLGDVSLGDVQVLPPTLTLQYHLAPENEISPYVGAGINYTFLFDSDAPGGVVTSTGFSDAFGFALQAGVDVWISQSMFVNLDVKKIFLNTNVSVNGGAIKADVDLDPWVFGFGVGFKF